MGTFSLPMGTRTFLRVFLGARFDPRSALVCSTFGGARVTFALRGETMRRLAGAITRVLPEDTFGGACSLGPQSHVWIIHLTDRAPTARFNSWFNGRDSSRIAPSLRWVFVPSAEQNNWISQVVLCQSVRGANGREPFQVLNMLPLFAHSGGLQGVAIRLFVN